jgi:hypothetical protein
LIWLYRTHLFIIVEAASGFADRGASRNCRKSDSGDSRPIDRGVEFKYTSKHRYVSML